MERVLEYWQHGLQLQTIVELKPESLKEKAFIISDRECNNGKIEQQAVIEPLLMRGQSSLVAPIFAQKDDQFFIPMLLHVELNPACKFSPGVNSLPIIIKSVLEPAEPSPALLGNYDAFEDYFIMQPPLWIDNAEALSWQSQLQYALKALEDVTNNSWMVNLEAEGFVFSKQALVFAMSDFFHPSVMSTKLLDNRKKIELISAERNSGKTEYARKLIVGAWIEAAIKQNDAPRYVWLEYNKPAQYANISDFVSQFERKEAKLAHADLVRDFDTYLKGKNLQVAYQEALKRIEAKYSDKGGIVERINQLTANLKEAVVHNRHLTVLHSIWLRHIELVNRWNAIFDFVPLMQKRRLQRLYSFFKQNFPGDDVYGLNQRQLENIILDKMRRALNSERFVADALHQTENDFNQLTLLRTKCLEWSKGQEVDMALDFLWQKILQNAAAYWQDRILPEKLENIDLLIVEHAEYVSPMLAAKLLALSQRAIIMGNYNHISIPRFSVQADYELCKHFELINSDADFEDLQFDGVLSSLGNLWNLAVKQDEADKIFTAHSRKIEFTYKNIFAVSEEQMGSRVNLAEIKGAINWLNSNQQYKHDVAIYTTFGAQVQHIKRLLKNSSFAHIPIRLVQEPCFEKAAVSLFLPVYTTNDQGPYLFDKGTEILDNLIANTTERLVVIGDVGIFKPQLHSASGKFAKLLFNKNKETLKQKVVDCV